MRLLLVLNIQTISVVDKCLVPRISLLHIFSFIQFFIWSIIFQKSWFSSENFLSTLLFSSHYDIWYSPLAVLMFRCSNSSCTVPSSTCTILDSKRSALHSTRTVLESKRSALHLTRPVPDSTRFAMKSTRPVVSDHTLPTNHTSLTFLIYFYSLLFVTYLLILSHSSLSLLINWYSDIISRSQHANYFCCR